MKIIAVLLNPAIDEIFEINNFYIGGTFKAVDRIVFPVGKAISFSLGIRELSNEKDNIEIIALIGQVDIPIYSNFLKSREINFELIPVNGITRSNKTINDPINRTTTHIRSIGFEIDEVCIQELYEKLLKILKQGDFVVFSGSIPPGASEEIYFNLINACKTKGAITILDSGDNALKFGIKADPKIVKPNLYELAQLTNKKTIININLSNLEKSILEIVHVAKFLLNDELEILLITLGDNGALCLTENQKLYGNVNVKNIIDTVGSGDSFLAGFMIKFIFGEDIIECFRNALACGAANTLLPGPGIFRMEDVKRLIKDVEIKQIN